MKNKRSILHPFILKLNIVQRLAVSHVKISKMICLVTTSSVVTKLIGWFGN